MGQKVAAKAAETGTTVAGNAVKDAIKGESTKLPRQMLDPKKDVMVVKNNKVIVIDKSKEAEYLKKGWGLAEQIEEETLDEDASNFKSAVARIKKTKSVKDLKKLEVSFDRVYKVGALTDKELGQLDTMIGDKLIKLGFYEEVEEAVSPEQQAAIAISKKEKEDMKNEGVLGAVGGAMLGAPLGLGGAIAGGIGGSAAQDLLKKKVKEGSVKDLAMKIDKIVAKMNKDSKLKPHAKKFASMAMKSMDIEKSLEKSLPSSVSGAVMIGLLEAVKVHMPHDTPQEIARVTKNVEKHKILKPFLKQFKAHVAKSKNVRQSLEQIMPDWVDGKHLSDVVKEALDPVDDKANDKKFKDRKDKDIDNDGDVDSSDEYLHNRRAKVDDAIDGGKKPAKKEEKENEVIKKTKPIAKDMNQPVAKSPKTSEIEKIGEEFVAMLEAALKPDEKLKSDGKDKDGEELSKKATDDEKIDEKEPVKGKEFIKKHDGSDKDIEDKEKEAVEVTTKAGSDATKPKSGKRDIDHTIGDTKIVNPVKESFSVNENPFAMIAKVKKVADTVGAVKDLVKGEDNNKELTSLVDQARKLLSGETDVQKSAESDKPKKEKNPYDGRMKLAKEFMQRMDKRRGVKK